jgi:hypothetical protein
MSRTWYDIEKHLQKALRCYICMPKKICLLKLWGSKNHRTLEMTEFKKADFGDFNNFEKNIRM